MALQTGVRNEAYARLLLEPLGDGERVVVVHLHSQRESYRAAHDEPCVERADNAANIYLCLIADLVHVLVVADYCAAHRVAVTVDVFGKAFHNKVNAVLQRTGVVGRRERVVRRNENSVLVRQLYDAFDVADAEGRVAGSLKMDKLGIRFNCCLYLFEVCAVNYRGFDAPFFSPKLVENAVSGDICNGGEDNVVAFFQLGEEKRGKRRNAARQNYAVLAALKISDLFLQQTLIYATVAVRPMSASMI